MGDVCGESPIRLGNVLFVFGLTLLRFYVLNGRFENNDLWFCDVNQCYMMFCVHIKMRKFRKY